MRVNRLERRLFLQGAAGAVMALPWLSSLAPREVRAQDSAKPRRFIAIKSYSTQNIRDFYQLDVEEADGSTFLDNSLVLWGNELGMNHLNYSIPTVLAGSAGGYLKTGRYIDYIDWNRPVKFSQHDGMVIEGVPYNRLMVTLLQAFGLEPEDYESEPGRGYGDTSTTGKPSDGFAVDYDRDALGSVLPDIRA